jgi:hypothetical protein
MPRAEGRVVGRAGYDQQTEEQKKKSTEAEKAYKAALNCIPNKTAADAWGGMR